MAIFCYFTFPTTFFALRAEETLRGHAFAFKLVPVPRSISSSCGTALRCRCENTEEIREILRGQGVELESMHRVEEKELNLRNLFSLNKG